MATEPQIETPLANGTTDQTDVQRNEASSEAAGYPVQHAPVDYAALAQKHGVALSAPPNAAVTPQAAAQPAAPPDYAAIARKHGVAVSAPTPQPQTQQDQSTPAQPERTWASELEHASDVASGFYHQTVGGAVNLAKQIAEQHAAYYKAHPNSEYLAAIGGPAVEAGTAAFEGAKKLLVKDALATPDHPLNTLLGGIVQSHVDTAKKAYAAYKELYAAAKSGDMNAAALATSKIDGYALATALPMVGPAAANIGEGIQKPEDLYRAAGETGGLVTSILAPSYIGGKLAPATEDIAGVKVPVRGSVVEPSFAAQTAEGLATKGGLQKFDITQTQPAARAAVAKVAEEAVTKPGYEALGQVESKAARTITMSPDDAIGEAERTGKPIDDVIDQHLNKLVKESRTNSAAVDKYWNDKLANAKGDFGQSYRNVKAELSRFYKKADDAGIEAGQGDNAFSQAQREEEAAFKRGDVSAEDSAQAKQRELFEKGNGEGSYDVVRKMYSKLDAIDAINDKFTTRGVVKNTPSQFVKDLPEGQFDRGIIDGAALRTAVRELKANGTFAKAGVSDQYVLQLQKLGELLERSKVRPDMKPTGWFGKAFQGVKNVPLGAGSQLAYLMTHPDALNAAVLAGQAAGAVVSNQPTHWYNSGSSSVEEVPSGSAAVTP